jgi:hypothetical protein
VDAKILAIWFAMRRTRDVIIRERGCLAGHWLATAHVGAREPRRWVWGWRVKRLYRQPHLLTKALVEHALRNKAAQHAHPASHLTARVSVTR